MTLLVLIITGAGNRRRCHLNLLHLWRRLAEHFLHVLQRPPPRLRQAAEEEDPGNDGHAGVQEEAAADGNSMVEGDEGHGEDTTGDTVHRNSHGRPLRPEPEREDLRAIHPCDRPEADREGGDVGQGAGDADRHRPRDLLAVAMLYYGQTEAEAGEGEDHAGDAGEEQRPTAYLVEEEGGDEDEHGLGEAHRHRRPELAIGALYPGLAEDLRAVQHDGVDTGSLLEEVDADGCDEYPTDRRRWPEKKLPPHTLAVALLLNDVDHLVVAVLGYPGRRLDVGEAELGLLPRVGGLVEDLLRLAEAALHHQPPGRLRHGEDADGEEHRRDGPDAEHEPPAQMLRQLGEGVVGHVPEHDPGVDEDLRE